METGYIIKELMKAYQICQYIKGKSDLFSVVILLKYLLSKEDFKMLKKEIIKKINLYLKYS